MQYGAVENEQVPSVRRQPIHSGGLELKNLVHYSCRCSTEGLIEVADSGKGLSCRVPEGDALLAGIIRCDGVPHRAGALRRVERIGSRGPCPLEEGVVREGAALLRGRAGQPGLPCVGHGSGVVHAAAGAEGAEGGGVKRG